MYVVCCLGPVPWGGYGGSMQQALWCEVSEWWERPGVVARPSTIYFILIFFSMDSVVTAHFFIFFLLYKTKGAFL